MSASTRRDRRNVLHKNSVYVKKKRNVSIATSLYEMMKEDIPWPEDDPEALSNLRVDTVTVSDNQVQSKLSSGFISAAPSLWPTLQRHECAMKNVFVEKRVTTSSGK